MKRAIQQTIVSRRREEDRDYRREQEDRARDKTRSACDNFHTLSVGEESESDTDLEISTNRASGTRSMTKLKLKQ